MINSREVSDLTPDTAAKCIAFEAGCYRLGIDVLITSTYRDAESQAAIYAIGRTLPGKPVTHAKPGQSLHNYKVAFDFVPLVAGKAIWNDNRLWTICGEVAEAVGLEWGGRWTRPVDKPHCQNTQGFTLDDFQRGKANVK